ncbi:hypothetical protein [Spirosoma fluminis]
MKQILIFLLLLSQIVTAQTYQTKLRPEGNDYSFSPQTAKAVVSWKRFPRFSLSTTEWLYWGPRFRQRSDWDDDFMGHGFRVAIPQRNYTDTGLEENAIDLKLPAEQLMGFILMPGDPGQMPDYLKANYNALPDSDSRKAQITQYVNRLIPVTDEAAARLMGRWMGAVIKQQCGGKNPKYVTIDEESAHYWEHPMGESSLRVFVGYLYLGIQEVCQGSKVYTYGPKIVTAPWYYGYADKGRHINKYHFTEHPLYAPNFWWKKNSTTDPIDVDGPLAQALKANGGGVAAGDHYWRSTIGTGTIYQKDAAGKYIYSNGRRVLRTDNSTVTLFGQTVKIYGNDQTFHGNNEYDFWTSWLYEDVASEEANRYWMNGQKYALRRNDRSADFAGVHYGDWYRTNTEEANAPGQGDSRPLNPQSLEMSAIFRSVMFDVNFLWHGEYLQRGPTTHANGAIQFPGVQGGQGGYKTNLGQYEYIVKGLHRVSELDGRNWGNWYWIRAQRGIGITADKWKEPVIRGRISETGNNVLIAAAWPMLDPEDNVRVDVWVDTGAWKSGSTYFTITGRTTYLDAWQIPAVPAGVQILPQHLRFRFTTPLLQTPQTVTWTGDYRFTASNSEALPTAIP